MFEFIKPGISIIKTQDNTNEVLKSLQSLINNEILVGITSEKAVRPGEPINNAMLAYIHEHGSPAHNIPKREIFQPCIKAHKEDISKLLAGTMQVALKGQDPKPKMNYIADKVAGWCRQWFTDPRNNWPPDKPATVKRKGSDRPLIDTGALRQSITGVVRPHGAD
jgi:hypothetical protein